MGSASPVGSCHRGRVQREVLGPPNDEVSEWATLVVETISVRAAIGVVGTCYRSDLERWYETFHNMISPCVILVFWRGRSVKNALNT